MRREPATVRLFAQSAEAAGYDHLAAPDHVLAVNVASRPGGGARNTASAQQRLSSGTAISASPRDFGARIGPWRSFKEFRDR
jgi:hypothetical protein